MQDTIVQLSDWRQRKQSQQKKDAKKLAEDIDVVANQLELSAKKLVKQYGEAELLGALLDISYKRVLRGSRCPLQAQEKMRELVKYTIAISDKSNLKM